MRLGELLRRDRERMRLTLAHVAGRIGITAAKLRRIEEGELIAEYETSSAPF